MMVIIIPKEIKMSKRFELSINIIDKSYTDQLIVSLVRQGYAVYYNEDTNKVCFETNDEELVELTYGKLD